MTFDDDQVARRQRAGHHAGLRVLQRLLPAERLDVLRDDFIDRLGRSGGGGGSRAAALPAWATRRTRAACARRPPRPPGPPGPPRPPRPRPAAAAAACSGVMSIASGAVRTGLSRPLWHDAQLTRGLPSKKVALSLIDHLHHLARGLLRFLVVEIVLPLHVAVVALHAQRRRDVLHRQLQLIGRDVFQDLDVLRGPPRPPPGGCPGACGACGGGCCCAATAPRPVRDKSSATETAAIEKRPKLRAITRILLKRLAESSA